MSDRVTKLFNDFDRGRLSRRQLLQALGLAAAAAPLASIARPLPVFAQGSCGGDRAKTPQCDHTPAKLPFEPTGWKTVWLDHIVMDAADYQKETAYFVTLMNWKLRQDDGKSALLDIGDNVGGFLIRGGYQPPPPPTPPPTPPANAGGGAAAGGAAGGGQGRGGGGGRGRVSQVTISGFAWGIDKWNAKTVEAELKKRGLNPVADNDAKRGFESFKVVDNGGFDLWITNGTMKNRRSSPATAKLSVPAPFEPTNWKTIWLDHLSFGGPDYKGTMAFYQALLGWMPGDDEGSQNECRIGEDVGNAIVRGTNMSPTAVSAREEAARQAAANGTTPTGRGGGGGAGRNKNGIDHIAFGLQPWDPDAVGAELEKRGLSHSIDTGGNGSTPDALRVAKYQSYHTNTPNGFNLQISNGSKASRNTR